MATAMYAWTEIKTGEKVIKAGEKVSEKDFSEADWAQFLDSRTVRSQPFPDMPANFSGSPRDFMIKEINAQLEVAEDALGDEDLLAAEKAADGVVDE